MFSDVGLGNARPMSCAPLYPVNSESEKISFNQLKRATGHEVPNDDILRATNSIRPIHRGDQGGARCLVGSGPCLPNHLKYKAKSSVQFDCGDEAAVRVEGGTKIERLAAR